MTTKIGYAAMLEQFHPTDLLDYCAAAEDAGFSAGFMVSEHFHPWTPQQGQSAFAWSFMGALGTRTTLPFGTAVTCPGFRYHPAVIAHAAATLGAMFPGRFWLGLGAGEALNEHVMGGEWPEADVRSAMLFEAIEVINKLFTGNVVKHRGEHFKLESAKLYTRPETPVPIYVATAGPVNAKRTGKFADGMITVGAADEKIGMLWEKFDEGAREAGKDPAGKPKMLQIHLSWDRNRRAGDGQRPSRVAERRDGVPEAGHQEPRGLRADGEAGSPGAFHQPMEVPPASRPDREHPALRRHGLRRDPSPQRRPEPEGIHRGLRSRGAAEPAPWLGRSPGRSRRPARDAGDPLAVTAIGSSFRPVPTVTHGSTWRGSRSDSAEDRTSRDRGGARGVGSTGRRRLVRLRAALVHASTERLREPMARLVGASPSEVAVLNALTVNIHVLLASFFRRKAGGDGSSRTARCSRPTASPLRVT